MPYLQKRDILLCIIPCYIDAFRLRRELQTLSFFGLNREQVVLLCNSEEDTILAREIGFQSEYINQNCWVDEKLFRPDKAIEKDLDAVLICSPLPLKRATLAAQVENLAVVTHTPYPTELKEKISPLEYHEQISYSEIVRIINRARVGLCLSPFEGACYAASEYLLCGIPIVSTLSRGGRNVWYTPNNHMLCEASEQSVASIVETALCHSFDSNTIRGEHLERSQMFRFRFYELLQRLADLRGVEENWGLVVEKQFFNQMSRFEKTEIVLRKIR